MSETTTTPEVDVNDLLGGAPEAPAVTEAAPAADPAPEQELDEAPELDELADPEAHLEVDPEAVDTDAETLALQEAAADVADAQRVLEDAKARYAVVAARMARRQQEAAPLHVQNQAVRDAQLAEAATRQRAIDNLAKLGFDPEAVNILAGGVRVPPAPRKPHPPLFPVKS